MEEFDSLYANVKYVEKDNLVLLTWKRFCSHEDYRQPTSYALELLQSHQGACFVVDARNGFEDDKEDVEWGFTYLLPAIGKSGCKKAGFIMNEVCDIQDEMNMWFVEFQKYVTLYQDTDYEALVLKMKNTKQIKQKKSLKQKSKFHFLKVIGIAFALLLILLVVVSGIYLSDYYHSTKSIEEYIEQSDLSIVQEDSMIIVSGEKDNQVGVIFYPGGKVEYTAYIPLLEELAKYGYTCYLPKMPGNLAVFGVNKADSIIMEHPETTKWILAGHSLGGAMAASYASENSEKLTGLILMGAYPVSDLSNTGIKILSIIGSEDLITNQENYETGKTYVSSDAEYYILEGGNHGYFGDYGMQDGDGTGTITPKQQWEQTAAKISEFFGFVDKSTIETSSYVVADLSKKEVDVDKKEAAVYKNKMATDSISASNIENYDFQLVFGGDINFDENWGTMGFYNQQPGGIEDCISSDLIAIMQQADIMCLNNEFTYSNEGTPMNGKLYTFRAKPERVCILEELGVDVVNLANNHIYDYGKIAFGDTIDTLKESEINYVGAGADLKEASAPVYFELDGKTIAYVAASRAEKFKLTPQATKDSPGILLCYDTTQFLATIKEARENADFVIAYVHWGTEYSFELEQVQQTDGRAFIDAGADVVIGAHPHCLQGMEYYKGKPIIYSLGNLWFNEKTLDTMLLELHFYKDGDAIGMDVKVIPAIQKEYQTKGASTTEEKERIFSFLESISINVEIDDSGRVREIEN